MPCPNCGAYNVTNNYCSSCAPITGEGSRLADLDRISFSASFVWSWILCSAIATTLLVGIYGTLNLGTVLLSAVYAFIPAALIFLLLKAFKWIVGVSLIFGGYILWVYVTQTDSQDEIAKLLEEESPKFDYSRTFSGYKRSYVRYYDFSWSYGSRGARNAAESRKKYHNKFLSTVMNSTRWKQLPLPRHIRGLTEDIRLFEKNESWMKPFPVRATKGYYLFEHFGTDQVDSETGNWGIEDYVLMIFIPQESKVYQRVSDSNNLIQSIAPK